MTRILLATAFAWLLIAASAPQEWWIVDDGRCVKAAEFAREMGVPALADPNTFMNYNRFQGIYAGWHWSPKRPDGALWIEVLWGTRRGLFGEPITPAEHIFYYSNETFCLVTGR